MSAFVSVFLAAAVIALTVLPCCTADRRLHRACFAADLALCILGAVLLILSLSADSAGRRRIYGDSARR